MRLMLVVAFMLSSTAGQAAEVMKVLPLSPPSSLMVDGAGDQQAATIEKFGQVSVLEVSLAKKIDASDSSLDAVKQHAKFYDFYLVPLKFGVVGFDGKTCTSLQFGTTLKAAGADVEQVFILNVFPSSKIKEGSLKADGKVLVSSELKVTTPDALPASSSVAVGGSANLNWEWNPVFQQVAAVYDQNKAIWTFEAVGGEFPVGQVEVGAIVAIAKSFSKGRRTRLGFDAEIRASFGGGWFDRIGVARANTTVLVRLP